MHAIYGLVDPRDRKVFYVGQTIDVYKRFVEHISCGSNNFARNVKIIELRALNLMVIMEVFELVEDKEEANEREEYWIEHFDQSQHPLTNIALMSAPKKARREQLKRAMSISTQLTELGLQPEENVSPASVPVVQQRKISLEEALEAWNAGHNSMRKLSSALSMNFNQARVLVNAMHVKGLIDKHNKQKGFVS